MKKYLLLPVFAVIVSCGADESFFTTPEKELQNCQNAGIDKAACDRVFQGHKQKRFGQGVSDKCEEAWLALRMKCDVEAYVSGAKPSEAPVKFAACARRYKSQLDKTCDREVYIY